MVGNDTARERLPAKFGVDAIEQHDRGDEEFAAGDAHDRRDDGEPGGKAGHGLGDAGEGEGVGCSVGAQTVAAAISSKSQVGTLSNVAGGHPGGPGCAGPGSGEAAGEQIDQDWPAPCYFGVGDGDPPRG
jgi:hypothetical protein